MYRVGRFVNKLNNNNNINPSLIHSIRYYPTAPLLTSHAPPSSTTHSPTSTSNEAPPKLTRDNFLNAKALVQKQKIGVGHAVYDQKTNTSKINWAYLGGVAAPDQIKVLVSKDFYIQGTGDNVIKFLDYLQGVPIRTNLCNVDTGKWEDGKGSDCYTIIAEKAKYNANTKASKIITDYIQERIYKDAKSIIPFISSEDIVDKITGGKFKDLSPLIKEIVKDLISRGYEQLDDFLPDGIIKEKKQTFDKYYTVITEGELNTDKKFIVQLTCYPPPIRKDIKTRSVYKYDKDIVYLRDIKEMVEKHVKKDKKQPLSKQMLEAMKKLKDMDILQ